ncbi:MAG TPA: glycosyltransferase [Anaerolineae bacterium]|nr:glycosyltransferase [Anaerolineae bacterium]
MHQYTADLANRLHGQHQISLVASSLLPTDRYDPAITRYTPYPIKTTGLSAQTTYFSWLYHIYQQIKKLQPDVVHFTGPHMWHVPLIAWLNRHFPTIHTIHDITPHAGRRFGWLLYLWNWAILHLSKTILVHGQRYQKQLQTKPQLAPKIAYTPLGHLFLSHPTPPPPTPSPAPSPFILFFGRLEHYKGITNLLTACAQLATDTLPTRIIIAGPGNIKTHWPHPLPPNVELRNHLIPDDEAFDLFNTCSALVLPYISATQSALIGAAYFFSKPVIVTNSGALAEYVRPQETGFVIPFDQPTALVDTLRYAFQNPDTLRHMGQAGHQWYQQWRQEELSSLTTLYQQAIISK